jgi:hypothetical protein
MKANAAKMWRRFFTGRLSVMQRVKMKRRMPLLNWSPGALAALRNKYQREYMTRLFEACFRVAEEKSHEPLTGTILHPDLPTKGRLDSVDARQAVLRRIHGGHDRVGRWQPDRKRYHFYAKFTKNNGWVVQAALKLEYQVMSRGAALR